MSVAPTGSPEALRDSRSVSTATATTPWSLGPEIPADVLKFAAIPAQRELLLHVHELLGSIAYGTVVLVLKDGKVIQVETSEKIRLR